MWVSGCHITGIPLVYTAHSLGRDKRLGCWLPDCGGNRQRYHLGAYRPREGAHASMVAASSRNEVKDQYELYDFYHPDYMAVIPPGTDLKPFHPLPPGEHETIRAQSTFLRKPTSPSSCRCRVPTTARISPP
jgi:sucrose-phosphate synthase